MPSPESSPPSADRRNFGVYVAGGGIIETDTLEGQYTVEPGGDLRVGGQQLSPNTAAPEGSFPDGTQVPSLHDFSPPLRTVGDIFRVDNSPTGVGVTVRDGETLVADTVVGGWGEEAPVEPDLNTDASVLDTRVSGPDNAAENIDLGQERVAAVDSPRTPKAIGHNALAGAVSATTDGFDDIGGVKSPLAELWGGGRRVIEDTPTTTMPHGHGKRVATPAATIRPPIEPPVVSAPRSPYIN